MYNLFIENGPLITFIVIIVILLGSHLLPFFWDRLSKNKDKGDS